MRRCSALETEEHSERQSRVGRERWGIVLSMARRLPRKRRGMGLGVAATWDEGVARTWRRHLLGLRVERRRWVVDNAGARWRVVTEPSWCRRARLLGHTAMGHHGPLASGPCHFSDFFQDFPSCKFEIQKSDLLNVQNSPNFA
jgi:hypothetical protein